MVEPLRPATPGAIEPYQIDEVIGKVVLKDLPFGKEIRWIDLGQG
jgi:N-acetylneuraminate synthase